jgi:hypothetical protein
MIQKAVATASRGIDASAGYQDNAFRAYDAQTGEELWHYALPTHWLTHRRPAAGGVPALRLPAPPPKGGLLGTRCHTQNSGVNVLDTQSRGASSRATRHMLTPTGAFLLICVVSG